MKAANSVEGVMDMEFYGIVERIVNRPRAFQD